MNQKPTDITDFLLKCDGLKSINRKTYINGGERVENSAEQNPEIYAWFLQVALYG